MPQHLGIEVKNLERRMMDMCFWSFEEEEAVMIYEFETAVQMQEGGHILAIGAMDDLEEERVSGWYNGSGQGEKMRTLEGFKLK